MRLLILLTIFALCSCAESEKHEQEKYKESFTPMPVEWCINVCMDHVFTNFHTKGESWGTSSSSLIAFEEQHTFDKVHGYCVSIYEGKSCSNINYVLSYDAYKKALFHSGSSHAGFGIDEY